MMHSSNPIGSMERCLRCQGLMLRTFIQMDPLDGTHDAHPTSWRCINCGALVDAQILENRKLIENAHVMDPLSSFRKGNAKRRGPRLRSAVTPTP